MSNVACTVCHEPIELVDNRWTHKHGDVSCGAGDGSTAYPPEVELQRWLDGMEERA